MAERAGFYRAVPLPSPAAECGSDRRGRPNALASVGFVAGAKARSAPQPCVLWPHWSVSRGVSIARRMVALVVLATQRR